MSTTGACRWSSNSIASNASSARDRVSAITMAIGSPTNRTSPSASTRKGRVHPSSGPSPSTIGSSTRWLRSDAVNTATTPGMAAAAAPSIAMTVPLAASLRANADVQGVGKDEVVDEATTSGEEPGVFLARHPLADEPGAARHSSRPPSGPRPRAPMATRYLVQVP